MKIIQEVPYLLTGILGTSIESTVLKLQEHNGSQIKKNVRLIEQRYRANYGELSDYNAIEVFTAINRFINTWFSPSSEQKYAYTLLIRQRILYYYNKQYEEYERKDIKSS